MILIFVAILLAVTGTIYAIAQTQRSRAVEYSADVIVQLSGGDVSGFARAYDVREWRFPRDHGAHPEYQTEWWYFTGNLATPEGRRFGFQLALFRRAITPAMPERTSAWAANQVYFGDFAVSNIQDDQFYFTSRFSRGAAGLSGAVVDPLFRVWVEDWSVTALNDDASRLRITASGDYDGTQYSIDFVTTRQKPLGFHGDVGLHKKSNAPGNASYYYSQTRLNTEGTLTINGTAFPVTGSSWMDQEFSTSVLSQGAVGWDWFAIQLDNGRELMLYTIRMADGSYEPTSSGTLIEADGTTVHLDLAQFTITALDRWTSPRTGAVYPSGWRVEIAAPGGPIRLEVTPLMKNQELNSVTAYWEGASRITGTDSGRPVTGYGYVELTGYNTQARGVTALSRQGNP
jgi:predicted secreted hydrolase